ncbi:MAG TPA: alpha/beta fold hydrolase, partial [Candidatus Limnocylindrales bacterium]|nr:alpha/beta fold hydrolase [Candidatus Limnocylindrales bacterium]
MGTEPGPSPDVAAIAVADPAPPSTPPYPSPDHLATPGGQRVRWLIFAAGAIGLALGGLGIRSAAILSGRIDPDLVTTPELEAFALAVVPILAALAAITGAVVIAGRRWTASMRGALMALTDDAPLLEPAPRTGRLALGLAVAGICLTLLGGVLLLVPFGRDGARLAWGVVASGGLLLPVAAALLIWFIGDIERREALLIHALYPWQPPPGDRDRRWPIATMAVLAVLAVVPLAASVPHLFSDHDCEGVDLDCRSILVQADQVANDPRGATTLVSYGIHRASKATRGTLVIATGGPGVSGIATASDTLSRLGDGLTDTFDIVFFDTRGVGDSGYLDCPDASGRYQSALWFDAAAAVIDHFVDQCLTETKVDPESLDEYGSAHIAEDIETIRRDLGVERIALYAESYGT